VLPTLNAGLLSAAPLDGAKRRCARDLTNSPTDEPRASAHHHAEEMRRLRWPLTGSVQTYFRSSVPPFA